jgi:hypothetical protein
MEEYRLAREFEIFAENFELPHKVDGDQLGANLGIPESGQLIQARWDFHESGDSYDFGAVLGEVNPLNIANTAKFALRILTSKPTRGLTERIIGNKVVVVGGRDNLKNLSDIQIRRDYMDDVARVATSYKRYNKII